MCPLTETAKPVRLYIIGVWLKQQRNKINNHANPKQTHSKKVKNPHTNFALIKFMRPRKTEEKAKKQRNPFVFFAPATDNIRVGIRVIDNNRGRLLGLGLGLLLGLLLRLR